MYTESQDKKNTKLKETLNIPLQSILLNTIINPCNFIECIIFLKYSHFQGCRTSVNGWRGQGNSTEEKWKKNEQYLKHRHIPAPLGLWGQLRRWRRENSSLYCDT